MSYLRLYVPNVAPNSSLSILLRLSPLPNNRFESGGLREALSQCLSFDGVSSGQRKAVADYFRIPLSQLPPSTRNSNIDAQSKGSVLHPTVGVESFLDFFRVVELLRERPYETAVVQSNSVFVGLWIGWVRAQDLHSPPSSRGLRSGSPVGHSRSRSEHLSGLSIRS